MNWDNVSLIVLGLSAFFGAFFVALWISLVVWAFRDMRARSRDAFAQLLAALMVALLGPLGAVLYLLLRPRETLAEKYERSLEEEALLQDIEERLICPGCKQPIETEFVLCPVCHTQLRQPCAHCGRLIHPRWSVCPYCASGQEPIPGVEGAGTVTLLDLEEDEKVAALEPDLTEPVLDLDAELEPVEDLQPTEDLQPVLADEGQEVPADVGWEPIPEEPAAEAEFEGLFSDPEEAGDADQGAQADTSTDGTPRRPLSLFRRS